ncbi:MAG: hemerythrin domain-containing protein [Acidimicrobiales bacterium]
MADDPNAPADTNMMRIVHTALRRDLQRARVALAATPPPDDRQGAAIAEHVGWLMAFLEAHHRSEDLGLFPLVRERAPVEAARIDALASDHEAVAPAIVEVKRAAATYAERDGRESLVEALDGLADVLLPHLQREEDVMPVVSGAVTNQEWSAIEQRYNLDGKSMSQLAREGHWLIDEANAEDRARVLGLVPPGPRLLLLYGFGPSYRRRTRACWNPRRRGVQHHGSTSVVIAGGIDEVWDVVRDPTRVGEWSHECLDGEWVGDATEARPGARFRGRNKQGLLRWGRLCEVVRAEPYELVWRTVPTRLYPDSTEWSLRLAPVDEGTRIEQTFRVVKGTKLEVVYATIIPAHRDRTDALKQDLERIGALAVAVRDPNVPDTTAS